MPEALIDLLLAAILIGLSLRIITDGDLYRAVVLFIAFGLVLSLAWVRLNAPDIALAEAAIGAGLTGALLLGAVGQMRRRSSPGEEHRPGHDGDGR